MKVISKTFPYRVRSLDRAIDILERAMNIMGPFGSDRTEDMEKHWRDIKIVQLWLGGKQLSQMEVARWFYECETL